MDTKADFESNSADYLVTTIQREIQGNVHVKNSE
jgi:hypothetical protein